MLILPGYLSIFVESINASFRFKPTFTDIFQAVVPFDRLLPFNIFVNWLVN